MARITLANSDAAFDVAEGDTVLRAALRAGLGFPYECNVGSCGNCRFELQEGEVAHLRAEPPAWGERDRARKRWLGCQAAPAGDCRIKVGLQEKYVPLVRPRISGAVLTERHDVTHDIVEFRFRLDDPHPFLPGQYALVDAPGVTGARAYSMCNVAGAGTADWHFQIKRVPGGAATGALFDRLRAGDRLTLDGPYGMAWLREEAPRDVLCLAGGSGLSPMVSIARAAAVSPKLADRSIRFLYGGRTARDVAGEAFLRDLPGWGTRITYEAVVSQPDAPESAGWRGATGFLHEVAKARFGDALKDMEVYFAGPPAMAEATHRMLYEAGVPPERIHFDQFY
ncbi:MAG: 2Fe-2S iron-sulfur cluster-binding protein [Rhodospirillales bacterium]|jgi:toluene monooxygenase electron transfer component